MSPSNSPPSVAPLPPPPDNTKVVHRPLTPTEIAHGRTLASSGSGTDAPQVDPSATEGFDNPSFGARYQVRGAIGEGGMGEIRLCRDGRIGREVAMKVIRQSDHGSHPDNQLRFLREARVQGQLEHPSIVPVYDLGTNDDGTFYFTMKRVRGLTLEEIVERLYAGEADMAARFSRRKLLTAFANVCLTIHFAHARGVLHRDLKPANIMLGDYGEVYVLDWGVAKLAGQGEGGEDATVPVEPAPSVEPVEAERREAGASARTEHGAMIGTLGYMAPEQVRGDVDTLDARTDIYALGAILFELLALEPLHARASAAEMIASTLSGVEARPSVRAPERDVPPELEAMCVKATALDPAERHRTARALTEEVERFLDGDRDLERRRALADEHARRAGEAAALALGEDSSTSSLATSSAAASSDERALPERARAMREVGRALALHPQHPGALRTLVRLLTEAPRRLPPAAETDYVAAQQRMQRTALRIGALTYMSWWIYAPILFFCGVRNWLDFALTSVLWTGAAAINFHSSLRRDLDPRVPYLNVAVSGLAVAASALLYGPFVILPSLAAVNSITYMLNPDRSRRVFIMAVGCAAIAVPVLLEVLGLVPPSYAIRDGAFLLLPRVVSFSPTAVPLFLTIFGMTLVVMSSLLVARIRDAMTAAERRVHLNAWQLRQLIPDEAQGAMSTGDLPDENACFLDEGACRPGRSARRQAAGA